MTAPSFDDLFDIARAVVIAKRSDLAVLPGDITEALVTSIAAMGDRSIGWAAGRIAATYVGGASDDDLTDLSDDHWNTLRGAAVASVGQVTFTASGAVSGTIPAGTRVATAADDNGEFQIMTTDVDLVFASETSKSVAATAAAAGLDGNVAAAAITRILDVLFDSSFTVTNAARFVGGDEEQTDESLRQDIRDRNKTLRRATLAAIEYGAKQVDTVAVATAVESSTYIVSLYVSDADGNSNATMVAAVETELENWRAAGVPIVVVGATLVSQSIDFSLTVYTGIDPAPLIDRIRAAMVAAVNRGKIGATLYRSLLVAAGRAVDPDAIEEITINVPAADIAPASNEVIRTDLSSVTSS